MPGILVAFWVLLGLGGGLALSDKEAPIWGRPDYSSHSNLGKPTPIDYFVSVSPTSSLAYAKKNVYGDLGCEITYTAWVSGGGKAILSVGKANFDLDTSWSLTFFAKPETETNARFQFLSEDGKLLREIGTSTRCLRDPGSYYGELYNEGGVLR